jgi:hypothetical protein
MSGYAILTPKIALKYIKYFFQMNNLPLELYVEIVSYLSYRDMIMFKSLNKYLYNIIFPKKILYDLLPNSCLECNNLYSLYYRGKSFDTYKGEGDIKFVLSSDEKIIYQKTMNIGKKRSPEYYILTLDNNNFTLYEFNQELHHYDGEDFFNDYDDEDHNIFILRCITKYTSLNDFKHVGNFNNFSKPSIKKGGFVVPAKMIKFPVLYTYRKF